MACEILFPFHPLIISLTFSAIICGHPPVPVNAKVTINSKTLEPGSTATYICDEGYETFGNTITSCSSNGKWVGELPFCGKFIIMVSLKFLLLECNS